MNRAYSFLTVKAVEDDKRVIRGMATTPDVDRVGDIIDPMGVTFVNPLPLLWQHKHDKPIGTVKFGKPTKGGVPFEAELPLIAEEGALRERIEEAWQSIKAGLVRAVSIGFRPIEYSFMDEGGIRYTKTEVFELSAVTIPANAQATINNIKSFDTDAPAATGQIERPAKTVPTKGKPGASGSAKAAISINLIPKETEMKTVAEQIAALEASRVAKAARMGEIMQKGIDEGRSTDAAEQEEFDTLESEIGAVDADLKRFRALEKATAVAAKPVVGFKSEDGSQSRGGLAAVKVKTQEAPGVRFARLAKVKAISRLDNEPAATVAERLYGADSEVTSLIKAAVVAGSTVSGNWAANLVGADTSAYADFAAFLRPATILGKFGVGGVPGLRNVPFREPLISQTGGGSGYWVGEGKPKPLTAFDFARTTLGPLKVANIAVLTEENVRSSNPSSELIVRDALRDALVAVQDVTFIDPSNAGTSNVKPASITNGAAAVASTGTSADAIRLDVRALFAKFIAASNAPTSGVWIMSATNALALSMMVNALGQREFPGIGMNGGIFEGMPAIVSEYAGTTVALVNASDIYEADDGEIAVDMSREASVEMLDASLVQNSAAGTGTSLVSLWQSNLVGLRAERTINWMRRRVSAVAYLTGVVWGGAVPAS